MPKDTPKGPTIVLIYEGENQHTFVGKRDDRMTLGPGKNIVDLAQYKRLTSTKKGDPASDSLKAMIKVNKVKEVVRPSKESLLDDDITQVNVGTAVELVENSMTVEELDVYLKQEKASKKPRKGVLDAIDAQRVILETTKGKDDENEDD